MRAKLKLLTDLVVSVGRSLTQSMATLVPLSVSAPQEGEGTPLPPSDGPLRYSNSYQHQSRGETYQKMFSLGFILCQEQALTFFVRIYRRAVPASSAPARSVVSGPRGGQQTPCFQGKVLQRNGGVDRDRVGDQTGAVLFSLKAEGLCLLKSRGWLWRLIERHSSWLR